MNNPDLRKLFCRVEEFNSTKMQKIKRHPVDMVKNIVEIWFSRKTSIPIEKKIELFWGGDMNIIFPDEVSSILAKYKYFEEGLTYTLINNVTPGMTVLDIGAHFGYFTLLMSRLVKNNGSVHSFEPTPSTFKVLSSNAEESDNVTLNNHALWSGEQEISLQDFGLRYSSLNSIGASRNNLTNNIKHKSYSSHATSVDKYCSRMNISPDLIKIDAENSELEILKGAYGTIKKYFPRISVEVGDESSSSSGIYSRELVGYLIDFGYDCYEYKNRKLKKHIPQDLYTYNNLFFVKD